MARSKVFIAWSGPVGKTVAEGLKQTLLDHPQLEPWVSSRDLTLGRPFESGWTRALRESVVGICCLTPGSAEQPWLMFEAGAFIGYRDTCHVVRLREQPVGPIKDIQGVDGEKAGDMCRLLTELTSMTPEDAKKWVDERWPAWTRVLEVLDGRIGDTLDEIEESVRRMRDAALRLREKDGIVPNRCVQRIIAKSVADLVEHLRAADISYTMPAAAYPDHLIALQQQDQAVVRALALLNHAEHFWQERDGRAIMQYARRESERVFAFTTPGQLEQHFEMLKLHAERYNVFAISYERLTRNFITFDKDFSIINVEGSKVMADYVVDAEMRNLIRFVAKPAIVRRHEEMLDRIRDRAVRIARDGSTSLASLLGHVFGARLTNLEHEPVEMSKYIQIDQYDEHEEKHAYYVEMMERMVDIIRSKRRPGPCRILELGAGTGIFTKRLAAIENSEVVALEIDWQCFGRLRANTARFPNVKSEHGDSRVYDPEGEFHFVVSSFADHHIKVPDKPGYFLNVRQNLHDADSLFIVGDEFLPPHDDGDRKARLAALEAYHGHIIDLAMAAGHKELAELERAAWRSGNDELGDFKLSRRQYEALLSEAGFKWEFAAIGPLNQEDLGCVGVYSIKQA